MQMLNNEKAIKKIIVLTEDNKLILFKAIIPAENGIAVKKYTFLLTGLLSLARKLSPNTNPIRHSSREKIYSDIQKNFVISCSPNILLTLI